jgi:hypothetical protein
MSYNNSYKTPDTRKRPRDVAGNHRVKYCEKAYTEWNLMQREVPIFGKNLTTSQVPNSHQ